MRFKPGFKRGDKAGGNNKTAQANALEYDHQRSLRHKPHMKAFREVYAAMLDVERAREMGGGDDMDWVKGGRLETVKQVLLQIH